MLFVGPIVAFLIGGACNLTAAAVGGRFAWPLSLAALALPFFEDAPPGLLFVHATILGVQAIRNVEIARFPDRWSRGARLVRVALLYETDAMKRVPPAAPIAAIALGAVLALASAAALLFSARAAPPTTPYALAGWPRWIGTIASGYLLLEGWGRIWTATPRFFGWHHPPLQRSPILSRSLAEFWGVRWNTVIGRLLKRNAYDPLAKRRAPRLGVLAAFALSAALHAYTTLPAAGAKAAAWMGSFFLAHGVLSLVEARLGVRRWRPIAARAFVVFVFVATIPPFAESFLRSFLP